MITTTMNAEEIRNHFAADRKTCKKQLRKISKDWEELTNTKGKRFSYSKAYEFKCKESNQTYIIVYANYPVAKRSRIVLFIAVVEAQEDRYYVLIPMSNIDFVYVHRLHLYQRYAERMHLNYKCINDVIAQYTLRNDVLEQCIYRNKEKYPMSTVIAVNDGIVLSLEYENKWCIYNTFVPTYMLGDTQRESRDSSMSFLQNTTRTALKMFNYGAGAGLVSSLFEGNANNVFERASEIYAQYFND